MGASNTALWYSSLDREKRQMDSIESHTLAMRGEQVSHPRVELVLDAIGRPFGCQTVAKAQDMSKKMALILCLTLRASIHCWESRSSMSKAELPGMNLN